MNKIFIKQISVLSLILGVAFGIISIIPYLGILAFILMMFASAVFVTVYMKRNNMLGKLVPKDAAFYGAVSGFMSCIGFCASMIPLAGLISFINHLWFHKLVWYSSIGIFFTGGIGGVFVLILMVFFVALLAALMNSFAGMATLYFYTQILNEEDDNETFHIDN